MIAVITTHSFWVFSLYLLVFNTILKMITKAKKNFIPIFEAQFAQRQWNKSAKTFRRVALVFRSQAETAMNLDKKRIS